MHGQRHERRVDPGRDGDCVVTATAEATANYNDATAEFTVTVQAVGTLALNLDPIAGDDTVNIAEHEAGFTISGDTGSEGERVGDRDGGYRRS